jgi:hypothetical protein
MIWGLAKKAVPIRHKTNLKQCRALPEAPKSRTACCCARAPWPSAGNDPSHPVCISTSLCASDRRTFKPPFAHRRAVISSAGRHGPDSAGRNRRM